MSRYTDEEATAVRRVEAALVNEADVLGPGPDHLITDWVVVANWTNLHTGQSFISTFGGENSLTYHTRGLLHEALFGMDDGG